MSSGIAICLAILAVGSGLYWRGGLAGWLPWAFVLLLGLCASYRRILSLRQREGVAPLKGTVRPSLPFPFLSKRKLFQQPPLPVVILGKAKEAKALCDALIAGFGPTSNERQTLRIAAIVADESQEWPESASHHLVINETEWTKSFAECCDIRRGIVAVPFQCDTQTKELVEKSASIFEYLYVAPQIAGDKVTVTASASSKVDLRIHVGRCPAPSEAHALKRVVDIIGAIGVGVLALPFLLFAACSIPLTSKGPILYKQLRIGKGNRLFFALKFRTMFVNSNEILSHYLEKDPALRAEWDSVHKLKGDPRVTSIGRFLRRFSLDELPQIWNVLVGDMSLIGPRPIVVAEIERYGLDYAAYEAVRPGLTGLWQVSGRNDTTYQERVDFDSYYVRNWSLRLDARIMARTFRAVISGAGAY